MQQRISSEQWQATGRVITVVLTIAFLLVQLIQDLPDSALKNNLQVFRPALNDLGLYQHGWGMFAGTNTNTGTTNLEVSYADGSVINYHYLNLRPGYAISAWTEVMQDLQFDDNNDQERRYLNGFMTYTCAHPPVGSALPRAIQLEQDIIPLASAIQNGFTAPPASHNTLATKLCSN